MDRCAICDTKMTRNVFCAWIDVPSDNEVSLRVSGRLGFASPRIMDRTTWHVIKREGEAWGRYERVCAQAVGKAR